MKPLCRASSGLPQRRRQRSLLRRDEHDRGYHSPLPYNRTSTAPARCFASRVFSYSTRGLYVALEVSSSSPGLKPLASTVVTTPFGSIRFMVALLD